MKIIEWNCQGAFRKKNARILAMKPDILVIPECESKDKLKFNELTPEPNDFFWYGDNENKGIGIFSYSDYKFEILKTFNPKFKFVIPLKVTGNDCSFLLFAIWAKDDKENTRARYIGQIWNAINYYSVSLDLPSILTGDFNSNKIWDDKDRVGNHTDVVNFLNKKNIFSLYHEYHSIEQGKEIHPTFYMYRNIQKPYHIDYFFVSKALLNKAFQISIENPESWLELSDHIPLTLEINTRMNIETINDSLAHFLKISISNLSQETQKRFHDLIRPLLEEAHKTDILDYSPAHIFQRIKLIEKYEKLTEIDTLIQGLKN